VLVQVAVELEVRRRVAVGVFETADLRAGRRLAVRDAPPERTRVQRGAVEEGANFDALRGEQQLLLRNTSNPAEIAACAISADAREGQARVTTVTGALRRSSSGMSPSPARNGAGPRRGH